MAKITADLIRKVREETGAPIVRAKQVLEEQDGNIENAKEILMKEGFEKTEKRSERDTGQGAIKTYVHHTGKVASMVELLTETDFVARNELFQQLAENFAIQIASMDPENEDELLKQEFIKDTSKTMEELVKEVIAKTGENIRLGRFYRIEIGK